MFEKKKTSSSSPSMDLASCVVRASTAAIASPKTSVPSRVAPPVVRPPVPMPLRLRHPRLHPLVQPLRRHRQAQRVRLKRRHRERPAGRLVWVSTFPPRRMNGSSRLYIATAVCHLYKTRRVDVPPATWPPPPIASRGRREVRTRRPPRRRRTRDDDAEAESLEAPTNGARCWL